MKRSQIITTVIVFALFFLATYSQGQKDQVARPSGGLQKEDRAVAVMELFFAKLNSGDFEGASDLYGGGYQVLASWNPSVEAGDRPALLRLGCDLNGLQCFRLGEIVNSTELPDNKFRFEVMFTTNGGTTFVRGPCCGESSPPDSVFTVEVANSSNGFLVYSLPPYMP